MSRPRTFLIPPVLLATVLLGACGEDDDTADAAAAGAGAVAIERSRFAPEVLEVAAGATVTFENLDPYAHTVTSADGSPVEFDSGEITQDETFEQTFDEAGTYGYFCEIHPTMTAEVVVS